MKLLIKRTLSIVLALLAVTAFSTQMALAGACDADLNQDLPKDTITASWYGKGFNGHRTTSGAKFDENKLTAAHATLPLNTVVEVTNLVNGKKVQVTVNDRGLPSSGEIDLSLAAAKSLGMVKCGLVLVVLTILPHPAKAK